MTCSRRLFLAGMGAGALAIAIKPAQSVLAGEEEAEGVKKIRYGIIHDETACIGCEACMQACRDVNKVPEGYDRLQIIRTGPFGEYPFQQYSFFRKSCQQCDNPPCAEVCPTGATHLVKDLGIVDIHPHRCIGCLYCVMACPYKVRFVNPITRVIDKCDFCRHTNLAQGKDPACVEACPVKALTFGDLNDPNSEINKRLQTATYYQHKVNLGTKPKMYRIPKGKERS